MNIAYPYLRRCRRSGGVRIEVVADSMRVGKTTVVQVIAEGLRKMGKTVSESGEDWEHNPYLKNSYLDPEKNFLESQKWFIKRKWEQIRDGCDGDIFIQDVSPEMDYCYAETNRRLGRMSDKDFGQYEAYYHSLDWDIAPAPDLLVYLEVSDKALIKRAEASKREFETVEPEYFLMMKRVNREWVQGARENSEPASGRGRYRILKINTDRLDFAHDERGKGELVDKVVRELDLV